MSMASTQIRMTDRRRPKRDTQTPTGKDLLPAFEAAVAGEQVADDQDMPSVPDVSVADDDPDEGAPVEDEPEDDAPEEDAPEDELRDVEVEEPATTGDGTTRWQQRRRRRRAARAARAKPKTERRRRSTGDEQEPSETAGVAAVERGALGRMDTGQDLFGDRAEAPTHTVDPEQTAEVPAVVERHAVPDVDEPVEDDISEPEETVEEPEPAGVVAAGSDMGSAGSDIGAFFAPRPAPAPTIVDRLGRTGVALMVAFVVVTLGAVAVGLGWVDRARDLVTTPDAEVAEDPPPGGWQPAVLLATTVSSEGSSDDLRGLAVISSDRSTGEATVLLIPTATVTDVPGFGSFTLAEAWDFGGSSLVAVTVDNLLGLRIDGVLVKDETSWAAWFDPVGGASIDVPSRIVARDGPDAGSVRFEAGTEFLTPARIGEYLIVRAEGETELQSLPRTQQVIAALSQELASEPDALETVIDVSRTLPGTATPERLRTVLGELADARAVDAATTITLPIVPLGTGPDEVYRPDEERLDALMNDRFALSRETDASGTRMAVQILNGNARPGIGQDVADALADGRYRIVLTGNADRFTYRETRILIYSDDPADLAAAQDISERLGVGVIERSGTPQSVVDVTIIVGADFPPDG